MNYIKTFLLMGILTILFVYLGDLIGGQIGMIYAFMFAFLLNFFSYWFSDKIILAMYGAKPIKKEDAPEIYSMVERLTINAGLPMPKIYIINEKMANAFATGRNPKHSAVALTTGIIDILDKKELEAVIAHELSHIKHYDILTGTIAATLAGAITMLARMAFFFSGRDDRGNNVIMALILLVLAPLAALLIQLAISRSREYAADAGSVKITGNSQGLINALQKLHQSAKARPANIEPSTAHMFIVNPLKGDFFASLFSTHPTLKQRIENLKKLGNSF